MIDKLQGRCFKERHFETYYLVVSPADQKFPEAQTKYNVLVLNLDSGSISIREWGDAYPQSFKGCDKIQRRTFAKAWEKAMAMVDMYDLGVKTNVEGFEWPL
jgi:hypothetical protein